MGVRSRKVHQSQRRADGRAEVTRDQLATVLDESDGGLWRTIKSAFHQNAFQIVIDRLLAGDDVAECGNHIVVGKTSFFPPVKRQEALSAAHHSTREVIRALTDVTAEMRRDEYGRALLEGARPRTEHASYSSLAIR
jgi:hypothetical protein